MIVEFMGDTRSTQQCNKDCSGSAVLFHDEMLALLVLMKMSESMQEGGYGQTQTFVWIKIHAEAALCLNGSKSMAEAPQTTNSVQGVCFG